MIRVGAVRLITRQISSCEIGFGKQRRGPWPESRQLEAGHDEDNGRNDKWYQIRRKGKDKSNDEQNHAADHSHECNDWLPRIDFRFGERTHRARRLVAREIPPRPTRLWK